MPAEDVPHGETTDEPAVAADRRALTQVVEPEAQEPQRAAQLRAMRRASAPLDIEPLLADAAWL